MRESQITISPDRWKAQLACDRAFADKILKQTGQLATMMVLHLETGSVPMYTPITSDAQSEDLCKFFTLLLIANEARAFTHMSRTWVRTGSTRGGDSAVAAGQRMRNGVHPGEAPDWIEGVTVCVVYRDDQGRRRMLAEVGKITRHAIGTVSEIEWTEQDGSVAGMEDILNLMTSEPNSPDIVDLVRHKIGSATPGLMRKLGIRVEIFH